MMAYTTMRPQLEHKTTDESYVFTPTQDWLSFHVDTWKALFQLVTSPNPRILEIGSWEGRSAVFLLTELCADGGSIVCIDHFDLKKSDAGQERYARVMHNLALTSKPFRVLAEFSFPALMKLLEEEMSNTEPGYDWVYVDGSHEADDTLLDGELAWRLARKGAIFIFDDYRWDKEPKDSVHHPKRGIDAFMALHQGEYKVLSSARQYQMILQKTSVMRIGFLVPEVENRSGDDAFGYGVHIVFTIDSAYTMPAAVAIRSATKHTTGRLTIYIVDLGLTAQDRERLEQSMPISTDVTLHFLELPKESPGSNLGAVWARISMIPVLPVERVLYLDADVLVRDDLRKLWNTDLEGKALGAVTDVGHPLGYDATQRYPYFNAGVLLMELTDIRRDLPLLDKSAEEMRDFKYQDQDALNNHFRGKWLGLSLHWNAQGLGTYAKRSTSSPDRDTLDFAELNEPGIVHFTGSVNPSLESVLNPYVQPYIAKPWGYAGAPGHPYGEEWWEVLDETAFKGWRKSEFYNAYCEQAQENAWKRAKGKFECRISQHRPL